MAGGNDLHDAYAKYLQARITALKSETNDLLRAFGESIGIEGLSLDHMTPELFAHMQAKVADIVSDAGNPALADHYRQAYARANRVAEDVRVAAG